MKRKFACIEHERSAVFSCAAPDGKESFREPLNTSEVASVRNDALAERSRKRLLRREQTQAWPDSATSESHQDGMIQTFPIFVPWPVRAFAATAATRSSQLQRNAHGFRRLIMKWAAFAAHFICISRLQMSLGQVVRMMRLQIRCAVSSR
jgi:hypothetical protein